MVWRKISLTLLIVSAIAWLIYAVSGMITGTPLTFIDWIVSWTGVASVFIAGLIYLAIAVATLIVAIGVIPDVVDAPLKLIAVILLAVGGVFWAVYLFSAFNVLLLDFMPMWAYNIIYILIGASGIYAVTVYGELD